MRRHYRRVAIAAALFATTLAGAQPVGNNPLARSAEESPFRGGLAAGPFDAPSAIARPPMHFAPVTPVTPVPEPSEWLMMAAGVAMVGFIVRRGARRS